MTTFYALMTGIGIGISVYTLAYLIGSGLIALLGLIRPRPMPASVADLVAQNAAADARQADIDYAARLADLDARAAAINERLATPDERATV